MKFQSKVRYWRPELKKGLAVAEIPNELIKPLGGLKQMKVKGTINGAEFISNVMPAGSGRLALSVNQKMMKSVGVAVGDQVELEIERI